MIDFNALRIAIRARLTGNALLASLVEGVFSGRIPSTVTWIRPSLEYGIQAETEDPADTYSTRGSDIRLRLMVHDRGPAPGVGSFDDIYEVLRIADAVLVGTSRTYQAQQGLYAVARGLGGSLAVAQLEAAGQTVWDFRRMGSIPEMSPADERGFLRMAAGTIYRVRSVED